MLELLYILLIISLIIIIYNFIKIRYYYNDCKILIKSIDLLHNAYNVNTFELSYNQIVNNINHYIALYYKEHFNEDFKIAKIEVKNSNFIVYLKDNTVNIYKPDSVISYILISIKLKYMKLFNKIVKGMTNGLN